MSDTGPELEEERQRGASWDRSHHNRLRAEEMGPHAKKDTDAGGNRSG